jgi:CRP/FNR family transcriptional regulator
MKAHLQSGKASRVDFEQLCGACVARKQCFFAGELSSFSLRPLLRWQTSFSKSAVIYSEDLPGFGLYLLCRGTVKLTTITYNGKERISTFVRTGELFGLDCFLTPTERRFRAIAREECLAFFIPKDEFRSALSANCEALWTLVLLQIEARQRAEAEKLLISGDVVERRLRATVSWLSDHLGVSGALSNYLPPSLNELGEFLGVAAETVCRTRPLCRPRSKRQLPRLD